METNVLNLMIETKEFALEEESESNKKTIPTILNMNKTEINYRCEPPMFHTSRVEIVASDQIYR